MKEPTWLEVSFITDVHLLLLSRFGGIEGVRDQGLLESALHGPKQRWSCEKHDCFDLAASYTNGLVRNHPFLDGNKRVGFIAAVTFLAINGIDLDADEAEAVVMTLGLAAGELPAEGYAQWLRDNGHPSQV